VWSYEIDKGRLVKEHDVSGGHGEAWFRSMSADGKLVVSSGFGNTVRIFDLVRGSQVTFEAPQHSYGAALSPDGKLVIDAGGDPTVRLRNVANLKQIVTEYKGAEGHVYGVNFSADGKNILACGGAKRAHVWDARSGKLLHTYELGAGTSEIRSSPNGLYAVAATNDAVHLLGLPK
jgi:WD40 repeat protein